MRNVVICLEREFGSGGHEIAVKAGERLSLKVYENELLHLACQLGGVSEKLLQEDDEKASNPWLYHTIHEGNKFVSHTLPSSHVLFDLQAHVIRRVAKEKDCILVGRCGDFVLRDEDVDLIKVFVKAPFDQRVKRKSAQENMPEDKERKRVRKMDHQRRDYYESYTGYTWGEEGKYDLILDTGMMTLDRAADLIVDAYRLKKQNVAPAENTVE